MLRKVVSDDAQLAVYNMIGELLCLFSCRDRNIVVDIDGLSNGVYSVVLYNNGVSVSTKFLKD